MGDTALPRTMWQDTKINPFLAQQLVKQAHAKGDITRKDMEFWRQQILQKWTHGMYSDYMGNKRTFKDLVS